MRVWSLSMALGVAVLTSGCATAASALLGAALCGGSSRCQSDMVSAGIEADGEILASAVQARADDRADRAPREWWGPAPTGGGEDDDATPLDTGGYFHCVDAEGHHVIELIAPSELDARVACAAHLGVAWSGAAEGLCTCASPD